MQKDSGPLVPLHWIGFGYAALVASGGIIGYAKAGSVPSLAAGLLFGSLAGLGAYQLSQDPRNIWVFLATALAAYVKENNSHHMEAPACHHHPSLPPCCFSLKGQSLHPRFGSLLPTFLGCYAARDVISYLCSALRVNPSHSCSKVSSLTH
uniref:Transmembrane protein 14C n=1 Tax=Lynx canadensis TaxID=61383 RepID=A0A667HVF9_LYNCA